MNKKKKYASILVAVITFLGAILVKAGWDSTGLFGYAVGSLLAWSLASATMYYYKHQEKQICKSLY